MRATRRAALPGSRAPGAPTDPRQPRRNAMNRILALVLAGALALVAGCNTIQGAGKDIAAGGEAIERAADKSKPK